MLVEDQAGTGRRAEGIFVLVLTLALLAYNATVQLVPGYTMLYVPLGLATTGVLLVAARRARLGRSELGLGKESLRSGLRWGGAVAVVAALGMAVAAAVPFFHPLLEDERVGDIGYSLLAYRTLVRIPFGTVILEEVAFRGVLFGFWERWAGLRRAVIGSSAVFGLWHVRPAWELLHVNGVTEPVLAEAGLVALAVLFTFGAGLFFCWLRLRSGSLAASIVAHAAINSFATVAAFAILNV